MVEAAPTTIENDEEKLELMGRHEIDITGIHDAHSLQKHVKEQLGANPKAQMVVFLYLAEAG